MLKSLFKFSSLVLVGAAVCGAGCAIDDSSSQVATAQIKLQLATCGSSTDQIRGCVSVAGILRVLSGTQNCFSAEKSLCWNQVGPKASNSLSTVSTLSAGDAKCATGGSKLSVGLDTNGNGLLDANEVTGSTYVCNGATGATGPQGAQGVPGKNGSSCGVADNGDGTSTIACGDGTAVTISNGAPGASGAPGADGTSCTVTTAQNGTKLIVCGATSAEVSDGKNGESCWDLNGNGTCDLATEDKDGNGICDTADCQGVVGPTGATGATGISGHNSLILMTNELPGGNCTNGGQKIETGLDANANNVLDNSEVSQTNYVCDGVNRETDGGIAHYNDAGIDAGGDGGGAGAGGASGGGGGGLAGAGGASGGGGSDSNCNFSAVLLNGVVVTGVGMPCGVGRCAGGLTACTPDQLGIYCTTENRAIPETCNGIDDDCDGLTDSTDGDLIFADHPPCEMQKGVCSGSRKPAVDCVVGTWIACTNADYLAYSSNYSAQETACDNLDNDCDGVTDEGCN